MEHVQRSDAVGENRCPHCGQLIRDPHRDDSDFGSGTNLALAALILVAIGVFVLWGDGSAVIYGIPAVLFGTVVMLVGKGLKE